MPVSEAQKRSNKKYDAAHMSMIGLKMPKEERAEIERIAAENGMPLSGFCRKCVQYCIKNNINIKENS